MIVLVNLGAEPFEVTRGMRIAQMVVARVERVTFRAGGRAARRRGAGRRRVRQHGHVVQARQAV